MVIRGKVCATILAATRLADQTSAHASPPATRAPPGRPANPRLLSGTRRSPRVVPRQEELPSGPCSGHSSELRGSGRSRKGRRARTAARARSDALPAASVAAEEGARERRGAAGNSTVFERGRDEISVFRRGMGLDDACMSLGMGLAEPAGDGAHGAFVCISSLDASLSSGGNNGGNGAGRRPDVGDVIIAFRNTRVSPGFVSTKVLPRGSRTHRGSVQGHRARKRLLSRKRCPRLALLPPLHAALICPTPAPLFAGDERIRRRRVHPLLPINIQPASPRGARPQERHASPRPAFGAIWRVRLPLGGGQERRCVRQRGG